MVKYFRVALLCAMPGMWGTAYSAEPGPEPEVVAQEERVFVPVTEEMLLDPDPADWLMVHRTYDMTGYSPLDQINSSNVGQLKLAWMRAMDVGPQELRPLVYDGVMYVAHPGSDHIQAWDATTGDLIWDYKRELPSDLRNYQPQGNRTRNLAIYDDKIYHLTWDSYLVALHAHSGELLWETRIADYKDGITHSSGAIIVKGKVISGRSCGFRNLGVRCFIDAELDLIYWGVAVPAPYPRLIRRGTWDVGDKTPCELYTNSTLAMDPDTGEIKWYYQHLPCDDWDADFVHERTLIDLVVDPDPGAVKWINPKVLDKQETRRVVVSMGEPGGLFVNDAETGEFLWAHPFPYDSIERFPIRDINVNTGEVYINLNLVSKQVGHQITICGHNTKGWWSWSYSPLTQLLYIPINRTCLNQSPNPEASQGASKGSMAEPGRGENAPMTELRALDLSTGKLAWQFTQRAPNAGATMATGGNLVFFGDLNRRFRAFDAKTGKILWETILGSLITGNPVTYSVDGKQYVAIPVGGGTLAQISRYTPELEAPSGSNMMVVFTLP
ncbi:MAG: PQQ-binding-like beta-propeller repeat protein [Acidobacteria bacterium]|nr:PQQ-binding-like beta-propeller repeat protein [Acidobacteriota bacterium]